MGRTRSIPLSENFKKADFRLLSKQEKNARAKVRLLALGLMQEGKKIATIAKMIGVARSTINDWVRCFHISGIKGLYDKKGRGRQHPLNGREAEFKNMVIRLQNNRPGGRIIAKDIQQALNNEFGIMRSTDAIYEYLNRCDLVWISSRSKHPKSSKQAQESFKENFLELVKKKSQPMSI
jgi:Transposase and inactivated derivatives